MSRPMPDPASPHPGHPFPLTQARMAWGGLAWVETANARVPRGGLGGVGLATRVVTALFKQHASTQPPECRRTVPDMPLCVGSGLRGLERGALLCRG